MIWGAFIRFFIEEYIAISIAGLLKMFSIDFTNWFEIMSSIYGIIALIIVIVAPFIVWRVLYRKHEQNTVWDQEFYEKYGALHEGVQRHDKEALLFHVFFMIRRFTFACAIVVWPDKNFYQTMIVLYMSSAIIIY